jgi:hypothetical protein
MTRMGEMRTEPPALVVPSRLAVVFRGLGIGAVALSALLPIGAAFYWLTIEPSAVRMLTGLSADVLPEISQMQRVAAAVLSVLTVLPMAWGLMRLRRCFASFAVGRPFAWEGIAGLRAFALGGMVAALAQLIGHTLMALILTVTALPGYRQLVVRIDGEMLLLALFAGTVAAVVWALEQASVIAQENSQFI